jgi:hypothetical protein
MYSVVYFNLILVFLSIFINNVHTHIALSLNHPFALIALEFILLLSLRGATPQAAGKATKQSLPRH